MHAQVRQVIRYTSIYPWVSTHWSVEPLWWTRLEETLALRDEKVAELQSKVTTETLAVWKTMGISIESYK